MDATVHGSHTFLSPILYGVLTVRGSFAIQVQWDFDLEPFCGFGLSASV